MSPEDHALSSQAGQLHHVELYCRDLGTSLGFWGWLLDDLGYEPSQEWDAGRSYRLGPTYLVFVQADEPHRDEPFHRCRPGLNHLAFYGRSREHVDDLTAAVREREDATLLYPDDHPHAGGADHYALYCEDPERLKVEVVAPE